MGGVCRCPAWIRREQLVGRRKTEPSGQYPEELCGEIARMTIAAWKRTLNLEFWRNKFKVKGPQVSELQAKRVANEARKLGNKAGVAKDSARGVKRTIEEALKAEDVEQNKIPSASRNITAKQAKETLNEAAIGGVRNPSKSVEKLFPLREAGSDLRRRWEEFVDKRNGVYLKLANVTATPNSLKRSAFWVGERSS